MSKNQPRDGNGKFAKTIKVVDKYGNSAYFTPEELEGFGKKKEEKNPDCEPATKGYVKCLLRKQNNHTHKILENGNGGLISFVIFGLGFVFSFISTLCIKDAITTNWYPALIATTIVSGMFFGEYIMMFCSESNEPTYKNYYENDIKKYEPPCEKKEDCS